MLITVAQAAAEAEQAHGLGAIGLDVRALLFQVLNFAILLFLLRKFAYRPILRILQARHQKITESLKTAAELEGRQRELATREQAVLQQAQTEAQAIVAASQQQARDVITAAEAEARKRADRLLEQANAKLEQEVLAAKRSLQQETLNLVTLATAKIIGEKLDPHADAALLNNALRQASERAPL